MNSPPLTIIQKQESEQDNQEYLKEFAFLNTAKAINVMPNDDDDDYENELM